MLGHLDRALARTESTLAPAPRWLRRTAWACGATAGIAAVAAAFLLLMPAGDLDGPVPAVLSLGCLWLLIFCTLHGARLAGRSLGRLTGTDLPNH
jgi:hypothetical protein